MLNLFERSDYDRERQGSLGRVNGAEGWHRCNPLGNRELGLRPFHHLKGVEKGKGEVHQDAQKTAVALGGGESQPPMEE